MNKIIYKKFGNIKKPILVRFDGEKFTKIEECHRYIKHLDITNKSPNTLITYTKFLKVFYDYLDVINTTLEDFVAEKDSTHKGLLTNMQNFVVWLQYPDYAMKIIHKNGEKAKRDDATVNTIVNTVTQFLDYIAISDSTSMLTYYTTQRANIAYRSFLYDVTKTNKKTKSNLFKLRNRKIKQIKYITRKQYNKIFSCCRTTRDKLLVAVLFEGGLRLNEALGLRIADCKLWDSKIEIVPRENNINRARVKNYAAGYVYLPDYVLLLLSDYLEEIDNIDTDYLFINMSGENLYKPMNANAVEQLFSALSKRSGIDVNPHALRHGFACERINAGMKKSFEERGDYKGYTIQHLQKVMRHKSIESTMIYAQFFEESEKEIARTHFDTIEMDFNPNNLGFKFEEESINE